MSLPIYPAGHNSKATSSHRIDWALEGLINTLPEVAQRNRTVACIAEEDAAGTHSHDVHRDKK